MNDRATLQDLVGSVLRDGLALARTEFALFKAEMASNATGFAKGAAMFLAASVFAVASLIWLTQALVYWLEILTGSKWMSALIVGALLLVIAAILAIVGKNFLSATNLLPNRTLLSVKRDVSVVSEPPGQ